VAVGATVVTLPTVLTPPFGTVIFTVDGVEQPPIVFASGSGLPQILLFDLSVGDHSIAVRYDSGGGNFSSSGDFAASGATGTLTINKADTETLIAGGTFAAAFGAPNSFVVTVNPVFPGEGTATGVVTLMDGTTTLASSPLQQSGRVEFRFPFFLGGSHTITATYAGDGNFVGSTSAAVGFVTATAMPTVSQFSSSPPISTFGQAVTFTVGFLEFLDVPVPLTGMVHFLEQG